MKVSISVSSNSRGDIEIHPGFGAPLSFDVVWQHLGVTRLTLRDNPEDRSPPPPTIERAE